MQANQPKLVPDQRVAYDEVINSINNGEGKAFFLDAPGGTGKTFLINLLLAYVRSIGRVAIAVASSGIAATLLTGGRTAHSTFKLPLNVSSQEQTFCLIRKNGALGKILQEAVLKVSGECSMSNRAHIDAVDRTLRHLRSCNKLFGGVTFLFGGDFRQTLPIVVKGTRAEIIKACLKTSPLWNDIKKLHLPTNMRAHLCGIDTEFP